MTPRLYDLGRAHREALDLVQADAPEGADPAEWAARQESAWQALERVEGAVEQKAGAIVHLLEQLDGEEAALEAWIASAKARRDQRRGVKARLRTLLGAYLDLASEKTLRTLAGTVSRLAARTSVVVDDVEALPASLVEAEVVLKPRMGALRVALEDAAQRRGPSVPGAHLSKGKPSVQVCHGAAKAVCGVESPKSAPALPAPAGCPEHGPGAVETSLEGTAHCRDCEALARAVVGVGITVGSPPSAGEPIRRAASPSEDEAPGGKRVPAGDPLRDEVTPWATALFPAEAKTSAPETTTPTAGAPAVEALPDPGPAEALTPPEPAPGARSAVAFCGHAPSEVETSREGTAFCRACEAADARVLAKVEAEHVAAVAAEANSSRISKSSDPASGAASRDPLTDPAIGDVLEEAGRRIEVTNVSAYGRGTRVVWGPSDANGNRAVSTLTGWRRDRKRGRAVVLRRAEDATPAEAPSALAAVAAGPGVQALAEPLRALGAASVIAEPLAPAPYLAPGSRLVGAPCPRGCGANAIPGKDGTPGACETCLETEVIEAQVAEDAAQAEREGAKGRAAIRQADGLAPDGTGPGLPLGPGGARPW